MGFQRVCVQSPSSITKFWKIVPLGGAMATPVLGSRRSNLEIVYDILALCDNGGVGKTAVMYGANLSYTLLQRYLSSLSSHYLIQMDSVGRYRTTHQGKQLLGDIKGVLRAVNNGAT
jgi:predicted transcriptional regulator